MQDEHLDELLQRLPRHEASMGFTGTVMNEIGSHERKRPPSLSRRSGLAAAAAIVIAIGAASLILEEREQEKLEAIAEQHRALESEIAAMREEVRSFDPVIDMGQDDGVRYILDLRPVEVEPIRTALRPPDFY
ncbi:MAG: hypothetical protein R3338_02495 [Thermoanaerobaculia bacterium]|nr:hypothetical protein [Thermoanaerobaculia bacterium]